MKKFLSAITACIILVSVFLFVSCPNGTESDESNSSSGSSGKSGSSSSGSSDESSTSGDVTVTISNASKSVGYSAIYIINGTSKTYSEGTYTCSDEDSCVFLVINGGSLTLTDATITKSGDGTAQSSGDYYNFYGTNSAVVVVGEDSSAALTNCSITTGAEYANAVFACDEGSITIDGIAIETTENSSRGLYSTYSGEITAQNISISTTGAHCAALATDRGGGTVTVNYNTATNTLSTKGDGSPCIYSTGTINLTGGSGTSTGAQAIVVESKNKVTVTDSTLSGLDSSLGAIMMYQSTSGDASDSDASSTYSSLTLSNSTIQNNSTSSSCPMIFVTNTTAKISSDDTTYKNRSGESLGSTEYFIIAAGNTGSQRQWGTSGKNGGTLTYTSSNETLTGIVGVDSTDGASCIITEGSDCTNNTTTATVDAVDVG